MRDPDAPLHIILRHCFFDAFASGEKTLEWRRLGARWNEVTCRPGRKVVLMRGYTRAGALQGTITAYEVRPALEGFTYAPGTPCAVMAIALDEKAS